MTTYKLVQITNNASSVEPWIVWTLVGATAALLIAGIVIVVKTWLD